MTSLSPKEPLYTTHQVAKILQVEASTVGRWFDQGILRGSRTPGGHRRVFGSSVARYLRDHGQALPADLVAFASADDAEVQHQLKHRILWIDNDPRYLVTLGRRLRDEQSWLDPLLVDNATDALVELQRFSPDMVVIDAKMLDVDGYAVCKTLKGRPEFSKLIVVLVTGVADPSFETKAKSAGADAWFEKPVPLNRLFPLIKDG